MNARKYYCKINDVDIPRLNPEWNINDIFAFADSFIDAEVEKRIAERMPSEAKIRAKFTHKVKIYGEYERITYRVDENAINGATWLRSRLTQKMEGGER